MGKSNPRHKKNRKHNKIQPTELPSVKRKQEEESELIHPLDETAIQNIIDEIQSPSLNERLCGLQSLLSLSEKSESIEPIIKYQGLKVVGPLLIDKNSEVRNLSAGVLRNLSASELYDVCEKLIKDDIMTPLIALLNQYTDWNAESSSSEDKDTLLQVVNILWNLCEHDENSLKYFKLPNVLNLLLRCFDYNTAGLDLSIAVCQCLSSVSEDNTDVASALHSYEAALLNLVSVKADSSKLLLLKTLAAGIVMNINPPSAWLGAVFSVLDEVLREDVKNMLCNLSSQLPLESSTVSCTLPEETQVSLESADAAIDAQTRALEILTNLTASEDDEMDIEQSSSEDEDEVNGWCEGNDTQLLLLSPEIHEGLEKYKLVHTVFGKIVQPPENVMEIIFNCYNSKHLHKKLARLQCRTLLCVNNMVAGADIDHMGGPDYLYTLVTQIASQRLSPQHTASRELYLELVESSTAAVRAVLLRLASINYVLKLGVASDLEAMIKMSLTDDDQVRGNVLRIVGTLGVLLVHGNSALVKMAANFLLDFAEKNQALWLTAEAVDCLLDLFADDSTDEIAVEINLVARLQSLAPQIKAKMRQERKRLGDHYPLVSTVITNLSPFIKYKTSRVTALK